MADSVVEEDSALSGGWHSLRSGGCLPATAQRLVERDEAGVRGGFGSGHGVLRTKHVGPAAQQIGQVADGQALVVKLQ
jgi:hypothetical protein